MMVKICGITELSDALAAAEFGASAVGFNFYPKSKRYIQPELARHIGSQLPGGVWKVGIFVDEPAATVERIARGARLDVVQIYGGETPPSLRVWRAVRFGAGAPASREHSVEAILLDSPAPGSGAIWDWSQAASYPPPIILAGGLDASNVRDAIDAVHPWGVDVCSGVESSTGRKDHRKMGDFIRAATFRAVLP